MNFDLSKKCTRHVQTVTDCANVNVSDNCYITTYRSWISYPIIYLDYLPKGIQGCTCSMFRRSKQLPGQYPLPLKIDHPGFVLVTETLALADREVCLAHIPYGPNSYIFAYIFTERYPRLRSMPPNGSTPLGKSWICHCLGGQVDKYGPFSQ